MEKRLIEDEGDSSDDALVLCSKCSCLSKNLNVCEHCDNPITDGNTIASATNGPESKRPRLNESTDTPSAQSNGLANGDVMTMASEAEVRPAALFVNNHAMPILANTLTTSVVAPSTEPNRTTVAVSIPFAQISTLANGTLTSVRPQPSIRLTAPTIANTIPLIRINNPTSITSLVPAIRNATPLPTYNLQPAQPPFSTGVVRLNAGNSITQIPNTLMPSGVPLVGSTAVPAFQIRLGSKKFKPSTPVTFKDDGILFTLTNFTYAPVLLNARAISKCKGNLGTIGYPVIFLFLENSCMRQIRSIFGLSVNEFSSTAPIEMMQCISIFPIFQSDNREQSQELLYNIKRCFEAMVRRYNKMPMLEEITNDQTIDILMQAADHHSVMANEKDANGNQATSESSDIPSTVITVNSSQSLQRNTSEQIISAVSRLASSSLQSTNTTTTQNNVTNPMSSSQAAPMLRMPNDHATWLKIQKGLTTGGIYHVLMLDGNKKYCLWNGSQLVPCLVQNTEVMLNCSHIRFTKSCLLQCQGQIKVRTDTYFIIHTTIKNEKNVLMHLTFKSIEMQSAYFSTCGRLAYIILQLTNEAYARVLQTVSCLMAGVNNDRMIFLFLHDVNRDQEEALTQMKAFNKNIFTVLHSVESGIQQMAKFFFPTKTAALMFLQQFKLTDKQGYEKLYKILLDSSSNLLETTTMAATMAATMATNGSQDNDDDDDLIMTKEEVGIKCPYTQQIMSDPIRNRLCNHNYEKNAIFDFINRKKTAKCPFSGCGNAIPLRIDDLEENKTLKDYITKHHTT